MEYGHMGMNFLFRYENDFYLLRMEYGRYADTEGNADTWKRCLTL